LNKKETLLNMIQTFEEHAEQPPSELTDQLRSIRTKLETLSNEEIEMLDGPTTTPASDKHYDPSNPVIMLHNAYNEMEKFAYTGEKDEDLNHVIHQMRGFYDIPDRHFP
jgi:hypothetical protein